MIYRPRGYVDIYLDTVHGYGKSDGFGGPHYDEGYGGPHDLHAWLVREMASYFTAQGSATGGSTSTPASGSIPSRSCRSG